MDILTAIHTRRSVRSFTETPVSEEAINTIIEAAMMAPSAGNAQPWQFIVIDDRDILVEASGLHPYAGVAKNAPLGILVCGDMTMEKYPGFWVQDCSAAIQNMLLAALAVGLGTVWTGVYPVKDRVPKFSRLFNLPEYVIPLGLILAGHPKNEQKPQSRYDSSKVRRNIWR